MLLTLTSTAPDASDLGFLLHKHPDRVQQVELPGAAASIFYPEATPERCTVALLLDVDPVTLVRGRGGRGAQSPQDGRFALGQYVNDLLERDHAFWRRALASSETLISKMIATRRPSASRR